MAILCALLFSTLFAQYQRSHLIPSCIDPLDLLTLKLYWLVYQICLAVLTKNTTGSSADVTRKHRTHLTSNDCLGSRVVAHSFTQSLTSRVFLAQMMMPTNVNKYIRLLCNYVSSLTNMYMTCHVCDCAESVHSVEQKSIGLIFRTSRSGSDVRYSCHHNSSRITFPIFVHPWRFSVSIHYNQSHHIYINRRQQYICLI